MKLRELVSCSVPAVGRDLTATDALALMRERRVDALPVVEENRVTGSVGLREMVPDLAQDTTTQHRARQVGDYCHQQPAVCDGDVSIESAIEMLLRNGGDHLFVPNGNSAEFGVVMARDLIRYLVQYLPAEREVPEMVSVKRVRGGEPAL